MKVKVLHINTLLIVFLTGLTLTYQACSPTDGFKSGKSSSGRPDDFSMSGGTTTDNPKPTTSLEVEEYGAANTADIRLCVYEIRFQNDTQDIRAEFQPKWIVLNSAGTLIDSGLTVPFGNYSRIELRLANACDGLSARVVNSEGTFNLTNEMNVRFSGSISIESSSRLVLDMGNMISRINSAEEREDVEKALTDSEGGCSGD